MVAVYLYDQRDALRRGAGLIPPEPASPTIEELQSDDPSFAPSDLDYSEPSDDDDDFNPPEAPEPPMAGVDGADGDFAPGEGIPETLPQGRVRQPKVRNVGKKKAASLARRDERRAYFEFLHAQRRARKEEEERGREEEEERIWEEKRRRAVVEEEISARREEERKARLDAEKKELERWRKDADKLKGLVVKGKVWELKELAKKVGRDADWVERVLKQEGLLGLTQGPGDKRVRLITARGYYVSIGASELANVFEHMETKGRVSWKDVGSLLERELGFKL